MPSGPRALTIPQFVAKKSRGERLALMTAYDYGSARLGEQAGMDALLVGDSVAMVVQGHDDTLPVTSDEIRYHLRLVRRGAPNTMVIADLPFLSFQVTEAEAVRAAGRMLKEGGAQAVKLEGGAAFAPVVRRLTECGIPVMGHLGLTPQHVHRLGGWRVQARDANGAKELLDAALALEQAGAFAVVLESVPVEVAAAVTRRLVIPTIGIGAGPACDGQIQVFHDLLGLYDRFQPRHARRYADLWEPARDALAAYAAEVRAGAFPGEAESVSEAELEDESRWTG